MGLSIYLLQQPIFTFNASCMDQMTVHYIGTGVSSLGSRAFSQRIVDRSVERSLKASIALSPTSRVRGKWCVIGEGCEAMKKIVK
jgi:hypothetical protein